MSVERNEGNTLYAVFLIEDDSLLGEDIATVLMRDLPKTQVKWVQTIEQGLSVLGGNIKYDVAVSDVRVPMRKNDSPVAHEEVAERLRELNVPTIFITGWKDSEDVRQFLRKRTLSDPTTLMFEKRGPFLRELTKQIHLLFVKLAGQRVTDMTSKFMAAGPNSQMSGTARLIQLSGTVTAYWPYLDAEVKKQIEARFLVTNLGEDGMQLSLRE